MSGRSVLNTLKKGMCCWLGPRARNKEKHTQGFTSHWLRLISASIARRIGRHVHQRMGT